MYCLSESEDQVITSKNMRCPCNCYHWLLFSSSLRFFATVFVFLLHQLNNSTHKDCECSSNCKKNAHLYTQNGIIWNFIFAENLIQMLVRRIGNCSIHLAKIWNNSNNFGVCVCFTPIVYIIIYTTKCARRNIVSSIALSLLLPYSIN